MKYFLKNYQQNIIDYINKKIESIKYTKTQEDKKLQKYEVTIILKFLWELHILKTKTLQNLLIKLNIEE